ncbi:hypothetical protein MTR_4g079820 [Medicago truncatula]|uniref:Uncharacterized protein n=1 Tax=Medicago truncatula TaxID=3880 RepID=G7JCK4_MEDTR|nr:hypothetical protein MTR_4g079820 [Medicago truncatula]
MANAVLTSLPPYNMQIQWFLQYACETLDRIVINFVWQVGRRLLNPGRLVTWIFYMKEVAIFLDKPVMGSSTRKAILNAMNFIETDFTFKIGDGDNNVWFKP